MTLSTQLYRANRALMRSGDREHQISTDKFVLFWPSFGGFRALLFINADIIWTGWRETYGRAKDAALEQAEAWKQRHEKGWETYE